MARRITLERRNFAKIPPDKRTIIIIPSDDADGSNERRLGIENQDCEMSSHVCSTRTVFVLSGCLSIGIPSDGIPSKEDVYPDTMDIIAVILDKKHTGM